MLWLNNNKRVWRTTILLLLFVALMGPWAFDRIHVPRQYICSPPNVRLEGDFCGHPLSGMWIFRWMIGGFISMVGGFITGEMLLVDRGSDLLGMLLSLVILVLLLLPFISTLRQFRGGDLQGRHVSHIAIWGLAALLSSILLVDYGLTRLHWALWGLWLYFGLAISALILEVLVLTTGRRAARGDGNSTHEQTNMV